MKKLFLVLIALVSFTAFSQQNKATMANESIKWVYRVYEQVEPFDINKDVFDCLHGISCAYEFKGDSAVSIQSPSISCYKKLYRTYGENASFNDRTYSTEPEVIALVKDNFYQILDWTETMVYYTEEYLDDMDDGNTIASDNESKGKKVELLTLYRYPFVNSVYHDVRIKEIERNIFDFQLADSIEICGQKRACWKAVNLGNHRACLSKVAPYAMIIEGLGFFSNVERIVHSCGSFISPYGERYYNNGRYMVFSHIEKDGEVIFRGPDYIDNGISSVDDVNVTTLPSDDSYYNLQGQRVSEPQAGIYIHNGKKVIVK